MLYDVTFPSYDPSHKDEFGFAPVVSRSFGILYQAIAGAPSGSIEQTKRGVSVFDKLKHTSERGEGDGNRRLKSAGAALRLTGDELDYTKKQIERVRESVPVAQGDALIYLLDEIFGKAKELDEVKLVPREESSG